MERSDFALEALDEKIDAALQPIIAEVQKYFDSLEGSCPSSFEAKQAISRQVLEIVTRLRMTLRCPNKNCQQPAKLRCKKPRGSTNGVFCFEHRFLNNKPTTHGGSNAIPPLKLMKPSPDRLNNI